MILADHQIDNEVTIAPFSRGERRPGVISYGVSSYGYDVRLGYKFKVFTPTHCNIVDPKNFDERSFVNVDLGHEWITVSSLEDPGTWQNEQKCRICAVPANGSNKDDRCPGRPDHVLIPPNSFMLGETVEYLVIPRSVLVVVVGKSTYARCGIILNVTPLEPEWRGKVTIEISNTTPLPAKIYAGEGIGQLLFLRGEAVCNRSYADKQGIYQDQQGLVLPKIV